VGERKIMDHFMVPQAEGANFKLLPSGFIT